MDLTRFFRHAVGPPDRTLIWGASMGDLITLGLIEKRPHLFDGAVSLCAPAAGTALEFDRRLDFAVAYDVAFGWPPAWGPLDNPTYPLDFFAEVLPLMIPHVGADQFGKWEFIRLIARYPIETFYNAAAHNRFHDMYFATVARAELNHQAGGRASQNLDHDYSLSDADKAYLAGLGIDADAMLAAMNERSIYAADHRARRWAERWVTPKGDLDRPVITVHNILDGLVSVDNESVYGAMVAAEHDGDLLVQTYTNGLGHCALTSTQMLMVIGAMESWLDTGIAPDASFFPVEEGFNPSYVPPPWPYDLDNRR